MLQPGTVIYLEVQFRQKARNKYLIILEWSNSVNCLIINSEVHPFFGFGEFSKFYVDIDCASHTFLDRDSHIDCNEVFPISRIDMIQELTDNPDIVVGQITDAVRSNIIEALSGTPALSPVEKTRFIASISTE